ncbi:hypothetical protein [Alteromonas lipolytica]|uniref:Uncharacterized protein n=1 Tax=Alteromonas lipolytica TaxID=1856405 RepID=A0A1E8FEC1_9ALTE|nr:hypothetical protein [Alteromonas lipolytica]OFI33938.1 hypothetical protein BFC17_20470 [Alteromonas lipolytica]GGF67081.1 hypothetical protein GCM10011338_19080 [Alteromonas lipolytica]
MSESSLNTSTKARQRQTDTDGIAAEANAASPPQDDISVEEVVAAITDLIEAKKLQFSAQWALVGAEAKLLRQSVLVTVLATLAALGFACVCWLIINATAAVMLGNMGLHPALIALILLLLNGVLMMMAWRVARDAFRHISLNPIVAAAKGTSAAKASAAGNSATEQEQKHD